MDVLCKDHLALLFYRGDVEAVCQRQQLIDEFGVEFYVV